MTTTEADKVAELVAKLRAFHKNGVDMVGVDLTFLANAASELTRLSAEVDRLRAERDEARELVAEANNSLYGSQGYFHSLNGGPFDKYHLANGIEKVKANARSEWHRAEAAEAQLAALSPSAPTQVLR